LEKVTDKGLIAKKMKAIETVKKANSILEKLICCRNKRMKIVLYTEYLNLIKKASYMGNAEAQFMLANFYETDKEGLILLNKNTNQIHLNQKAFYWYSKSCNQGNQYACHNLGGMYGLGKGVRKNIAKEIRLYTKAFNLGSHESAISIAVCYISKKKYDTAILWLKKLIKLDKDDGEAFLKLGEVYYLNNNYKLAYKYFLLAYKSQYITENSREEAIFSIGKMYFYGSYVEKSFAKAKYLFELANIDNDHEEISDFLKKNTAKLINVKKEKVVL
jgi:TPR repeat protein